MIGTRRTPGFRRRVCGFDEWKGRGLWRAVRCRRIGKGALADAAARRCGGSNFGLEDLFMRD